MKQVKVSYEEVDRKMGENLGKKNDKAWWRFKFLYHHDDIVELVKQAKDRL